MNRNNQPFVSVVTLCYNQEKYLAQCIESVLQQTYDNFEYIVVNNCSTDRSLEIVLSYARKDRRIKVVDNEVFLTSDGNCNHGLRQISIESKYCKVVLGDDWIFPECIEKMVAVAESYPSVGIVGSYRLDDTLVNCDGLPYPSTSVPGRQICRKQLLNGLFVFGSPTTLMFRSDIVRKRDPFYDEKSLHADTEACYEILDQHDFGFVHQVLSFTRRENDSITAKIIDYNPHLLDKIIVLNKYGRLYLSELEYFAVLKKHFNWYYKYISWELLIKCDKDLLNYHRNGLKTIGMDLDKFQLAKYITMHLIGLLLNPLSTFTKLYNKLKTI